MTIAYEVLVQILLTLWHVLPWLVGVSLVFALLSRWSPCNEGRVWWKKRDARKFYDIHKDQPFFRDLVNFMTSGPIVLQVLEGDDAIAKNREVMGATNPVDAAPGSIRKDFGVNLQRNSVHGSDSPETAKREIRLCFKKSEIVG